MPDPTKIVPFDRGGDAVPVNAEHFANYPRFRREFNRSGFARTSQLQLVADPEKTMANERSSTRRVVFEHPFRLPGMEADHAPGVFEARVLEEPLDVTWEAYHVTITLMLPSGSRMESWAVSAADLEAALAKDRLLGPGPGS